MTRLAASDEPSLQPVPSRSDADASPAPGATNEEFVRRDAAVLWHGFTQMAAFEASSPVVVERAEGRELIDVEGRRYFDAISSLWVVTLGHGVPELDEAVRGQLAKVAHSTLLGNSNRVVIELAEQLAGVVPVPEPHFLFASDGASAVEQALKVAFQYWVNRGVTTRTRFFALDDAYHGDTVGSLSVGAGGFGTEVFDPLRFSVVRAPGYADPDWVDGALALLDRHADELAAVVLEPLVQAASGMLVTPPEELARFCAAVREAGVLLIADEVATGFGRTGSLFACELAGVEPDLLCLGKGITGGYLPMSATVASGEVYKAFLGEDLSSATFFHGHSYGGNALAAAVALTHLGLITAPGVLEHVRELSEHFARRLQEGVAGHRLVREVRQCGLLIGVELAPAPGGRIPRRVAAGAVRRGVLLRSLGEVVPIVPPLTTTEAEADRVVQVLVESLEEVASGRDQEGERSTAAS